MDRWKQIDELLEDALEHPPEDRADFLRRACPGDTVLRREVESLLAAHDRAGGFIETAPAGLAAEMLASDQGRLGSGQIIRHYKVIREIGRGGMGEVYLAQDLELGRQVAVKLLPSSFSSDTERVRRFKQEARAASALNHPNIITIHEIGDADGSPFIVAEFIDGETLAASLQRGPLKAEESLVIADQLADALSEAHRAAIVHRDLKPQNIMINARGQVKVLDFGLAKVRSDSLGLSSDRPTESLVTQPGVILGTVAYMSPEQARGEALDARTDIFSFGVVLYEMLCGRHPFASGSPADTITAILTVEPLSFSDQGASISRELERVVRKCLEKDRDQRYRTMGEVALDLKKGYQVPDADTAELSLATGGATARAIRLRLPLTSWPALAAMVLAFLVLAGLGYALLARRASAPVTPQIRSLAVLPLKPLGQGGGDDYLGLGIADTVITKVSQIGELAVRPTSAVSKYSSVNINAQDAAREQKVDSVLDGTLQHVGDRLRINVRLVRADGELIWSGTFDASPNEIFEMQDKLSQQVALQLRPRLSSTERAQLGKRYTESPQAYESYVKGMQRFDKRSTTPGDKADVEAAIEFFSQAIATDSRYALARVQLAYCYTWMALFSDPDNSSWITRARQTLGEAERLDPQLAEVHVVRQEIFWSKYEGFQIEEAIRELRLAQRLNPSVGHTELGTLYDHLGFEERALRELQRGIEIDPSSTAQGRLIEAMVLLGKYDDAIGASYRFDRWGQDRTVLAYLWKNEFDEAQRALEQELAKSPEEPFTRSSRALLQALKGQFPQAESEIPQVIERARGSRAYHHSAYNISCIYALEGKTEKAVQWLKQTVETGMPDYPLFTHDPHLNRIRRTPEFIDFMATLKTRWDGYDREFE
jgi:serine/threonine-protein kinase